MLTNELIEDGENYYYVDANGVMVKNTWVAIAADDDETEDVDYRWYYFGPSGKAYKDSNGKTINGKKYGFDEDGKMKFGFVDENGSLINDNDDAILSCQYYFGTNDDGARHSGWLRYEDGFSDNEEYDDDYYWFWFASNGKKRVDSTKKINGQTYAFDDKGVMITEFTDKTGTGTSHGATKSKYFSDNLEDGSLKKSAWIRTSMPGSWESLAGYDDDDHWFRTDSQGMLITGQTKKINGKWYAFDQNGVMKDGLVLLNQDKVSGAEFVYGGALDEDAITADDIYKLTLDSNQGLFYFSDDEEKDGSMKTGSAVKISLADDDYKFYFTKTTGQAFDGVKSHKLYRNGILQEASDDRYSVVIDSNKKLFLVGTSGNICKVKNYYKDSNDNYWVVKAYENGKDEKDGFIIYNAGSDVDVAKACLTDKKVNDANPTDATLVTVNAKGEIID